MAKSMGTGYGWFQLGVCALASLFGFIAWLPLGALALINLAMNYRAQRDLDRVSREPEGLPGPDLDQRAEAAVITYMATSFIGLALILFSILIFIAINANWLGLTV